MKNEMKYYLITAISTLVSMIASGAVLQTFMLEMNLSAETVSFYVSATQILQMAVMLLLAKRIEASEKVIFLTASTMASQLIMILVFLFFCFFTDISVPVKTAVVYAAGLLVNAALGIYNIATYKFPYHVMDMSRYGTVTGISGAAGGIIGILFSAIMTFFVSRFRYFDVMKVFLIFGFFATIACFWVTVSCKDNGFSVRGEERKAINLFHYKPFWVLLVPNLFRGIHAGVFSISIAIGYHLRVLNSTTSSLLLVITNVASILSSLVFSAVARKQAEKWLILVPGIVLLVTMPWMVTGGSATFLVMYSIGYVAFHLVNNAVPVALTKIIEYQVIGQFSAWRMALLSIGTALAGVVCIPLIDWVGAVPVMLMAGVLQAVSGGVYFWYMKKMRK